MTAVAAVEQKLKSRHPCSAQEWARRPQAADPMSLLRGGAEWKGAVGRADSPEQDVPESQDKGSFSIALSSSGTTHQGEKAFTDSARRSPTVPGP